MCVIVVGPLAGMGFEIIQCNLCGAPDPKSCIRPRPGLITRRRVRACVCALVCVCVCVHAGSVRILQMCVSKSKKSNNRISPGNETLEKCRESELAPVDPKPHNHTTDVPHLFAAVVVVFFRRRRCRRRRRRRRCSTLPPAQRTAIFIAHAGAYSCVNAYNVCVLSACEDMCIFRICQSKPPAQLNGGRLAERTRERVSV